MGVDAEGAGAVLNGMAVAVARMEMGILIRARDFGTKKVLGVGV